MDKRKALGEGGTKEKREEGMVEDRKKNNLHRKRERMKQRERERTNEWFIELGRLPMSNREVAGGHFII